jgi:hypothetical protein
MMYNQLLAIPPSNWQIVRCESIDYQLHVAATPNINAAQNLSNQDFQNLPQFHGLQNMTD